MTGFINRNKRTLSALLILALLAAGIFAGFGNAIWAENEDLQDGESSADLPGSKDEVVYANLSSEGIPEEVYVVNILNIGESGTVTDYGEYTKVSNLTDTTEIINKDGKVVVDSAPGKFFYEGYGEDREMPWIIDISYFLDGKSISPDDLAGVSGSLEVNIRTLGNTNANQSYYDNYMLQLSVPMDMDLCQNIDSGGGTTALSGNIYLINYTVLPGNDGEFTVKADVDDFEMDSISINGIPFSMDFDVDEMTSQFDELINAVSQLDSGMSDLNNGIQQMSGGMDKAGKGSSEIYRNLKKINAGTAGLSQGSTQIEKALSEMAATLDSSWGSGDITALIKGLEQMATRLDTMSSGMKTLVGQLNGLAANAGDVPANAIQNLVASGAYSSDSSIKAVVDYATKAGMFIGAYKTVSPSLSAIAGGLDTISDNLDKAAKGLEPLEDLPKLQTALTTLSDKYTTFDKGLQQYLDGVSSITGYYGKFNSGMKQSVSGGNELASGSSKLAHGMSIFESSVQGLPGQIDEKIGNMLGDDDFVPESFVSDKNTNVNSVQFVMSTDKIKKPKEVKEDNEKDQGKQSVWRKITGLFKKK